MPKRSVSSGRLDPQAKGLTSLVQMTKGRRESEDDQISRITQWSDDVVAATSGRARQPASWASLRVGFVSAAATLTSMAFGYDVGVISGSLDDMADTIGLDTIQKEAVTAGLSFVAAGGALVVSGGLMDRVGRKVPATLRLRPSLLLSLSDRRI